LQKRGRHFTRGLMTYELKSNYVEYLQWNGAQKQKENGTARSPGRLAGLRLPGCWLPGWLTGRLSGWPPGFNPQAWRLAFRFRVSGTSPSPVLVVAQHVRGLWGTHKE
jgi:hypothetical protein